MAEINETGMKAFAAGEVLAAFRRVKLNSSQQVVYAGADDVGIGIADDAALAIGDSVTVRLHNVPGTRKLVCAAAVDAGDILYGAADGKVDDVTSKGQGRWIALEAGSGDLSVIQAIPLPASEEGLLYSAEANSAAVTNTTTETTFDTGTKSIDGAMLKVGDVLRVRLAGQATATNSTDTLVVKLYVGTELIAATATLDVADADIFYIDAEITITAVGASGALRASGISVIGPAASATAKGFLKSSAAEDLSGTIAIAAKATWSVASAANSCRLEVMSVELKRR